MSDAVLVAIISSILGPVLLLVATRALDRRAAERMQTLTDLVESAKRSNSEEHGTNGASIQALHDNITAHRAEFAEYREDHTREHQLINQIITTH